MHPTVKAARIAGAIYLSMVLVAPFAMLYVPGKLIVRDNAAATAENILAHETMFRLSIFGDLIGHVIFICLGVALYRLLSSVNKTCALLMVGLVWVSAAVGFLNTLNHIAAVILFRGGEFLSVFDKRQLDALAYFFLRPEQPRNFRQRDLLGLMAIPFRAACFSFWISAALSRRLANNQLLLLDRTQRHGIVLPGVLRHRVSLVPTSFV